MWIYRRIDRRELVLAIRGTASVENAVTDLKFFQEPYEESEISPNTWMRRWMRVFGSSEVVMCHRGFLRAFRSVKEKVLGVLAKLTDDDYRTKGPWRLFITGHSLGGGLATLFAHELALKQPSLMASGRRIKLTVYTYGCPRVGNQKFADNYNRWAQINGTGCGDWSADGLKAGQWHLRVQHSFQQVSVADIAAGRLSTAMQALNTH